MDALTLTPAWGGAAGNTGPEGDAAGGSSKGKQAEEGKVGGDGGGGGGGGACANETNPPVPLAYWEKARRRRTMSAQLVFPLQPPQNTAAIDQGDPSLCGEWGGRALGFAVFGCEYLFFFSSAVVAAVVIFILMVVVVDFRFMAVNTHSLKRFVPWMFRLTEPSFSKGLRLFFHGVAEFS